MERYRSKILQRAYVYWLVVHLIIVSPFPPTITGIGQYGYHVTRSLVAAGVFSRVTVLAGAHLNGEAPISLDAVDVEYCWELGRWDARQKIITRIQALQPDVIWFNLGVSVFGKRPWFNVAGFVAPFLTRKLGFATVVTLHELLPLYNLRTLEAPGGWLADWGARLLTGMATRADVVCLTMAHYVEWLAKRYAGARYLHIPHGAFYEPEFLPPPDQPELLFLSTLAPYKGLDILLDAFATLKKTFPALTLSIAGVAHERFPDYGELLKKKYADISGVHWLGQVAEHELKALFGRATVVVIPYRAATGSSSVLTHAATWGRAVIMSDLDEMKTLARESGMDVTFFRQGDAVALANSLQDLLVFSEIRMDKARHNFQAIQKMHPDIIRDAYLAAFNDALKLGDHPQRIALPVLSASEQR